MCSLDTYCHGSFRSCSLPLLRRLFLLKPPSKQFAGIFDLCDFLLDAVGICTLENKNGLLNLCFERFPNSTSETILIKLCLKLFSRLTLPSKQSLNQAVMTKNIIRPARNSLVKLPISAERIEIMLYRTLNAKQTFSVFTFPTFSFILLPLFPPNLPKLLMNMFENLFEFLLLLRSEPSKLLAKPLNRLVNFTNFIVKLLLDLTLELFIHTDQSLLN
ncbi:briggsae CBR-LGC-19, putative [Babesia ovata]|uniref:Briggsae CBR-LGC-19, putative n=1 Tax=Babesia ovata TaxID=189622 RepID=A0A2H6KDI0_9APIC|nr:briggsae CBR-LGC-19, putative [Babesia ovata]GBE61034.1 briggsae CBR-LGC-19, putative [Babesia ovata]